MDEIIENIHDCMTLTSGLEMEFDVSAFADAFDGEFISALVNWIGFDFGLLLFVVLLVLLAVGFADDEFVDVLLIAVRVPLVVDRVAAGAVFGRDPPFGRAARSVRYILLARWVDVPTRGVPWDKPIPELFDDPKVANSDAKSFGRMSNKEKFISINV